MGKGETAKQLFCQGYNCSQSVALAFKDELGIDEKLIERLTLGFGGGMGRMREVCGAVSGMTFVISGLYNAGKAEIYSIIQENAKAFQKENGSIVCRELLKLGTPGADSPTPEKRTDAYYKKRPCPELVACAADILEKYIASHPYEK